MWDIIWLFCHWFFVRILGAYANHGRCYASRINTFKYLWRLLITASSLLPYKHSLNSTHKSCKTQNNWFKCAGLGKRHKKYKLPISRKQFPPPLTSVRRTKTNSRPEMTSYRKSLLTLGPLPLIDTWCYRWPPCAYSGLIVDSFFYVKIYHIWSQTPETPHNYPTTAQDRCSRSLLHCCLLTKARSSIRALAQLPSLIHYS